MLDHLEHRIAAQQSMLANIADQHSDNLIQAAGHLTQALLTEGRVITCGAGLSGQMAQLMATQLNHRLDRERPSLPAICINSDASLILTIMSAHGSSQAYAHQIRAHAQPSDVFIAFSITGSEPQMMRAVQAAHEIDMPVILITQEQGGQISDITAHGDREIRLPAHNPSDILQGQLTVVNLLTQLIENQLFG